MSIGANLFRISAVRILLFLQTFFLHKAIDTGLMLHGTEDALLLKKIPLRLRITIHRQLAEFTMNEPGLGGIEQGPLIDDAIFIFRKIVERMPTTTWLLEAKRLVASQPESDYDARRKAEAEEEIAELRGDLRALMTDWVNGWYERDGWFVTSAGIPGSIRQRVNSVSPELAKLVPPAEVGELSPQLKGQIRAALEACAPQLAIELMNNTRLVVSDAMRYAILG